MDLFLSILCLAAVVGVPVYLWTHTVRPPAQAAPTSEPDPLDRADDGPRIPVVCLDCGEQFTAGVHLHLTPMGPMTHVNADDIELHQLTCTGAQ